MTDAWLRPIADGLSCDHDWSKKVEIDKADLPPFVKGPAFDIYCSICGVKQSLKDRIAIEVTKPIAPPVSDYKPPVVAVERPRDPDPVPLDQIRVTLNLEKYGKRYENDRRRGIVDKAIHIEGDPRWTDAMAAAAEEFAALALGLRHKGEVHRPDAGWDLSMQGRRIQVKWTRYPDGKLLVHTQQALLADYYVLVTGGTTDTFAIPGWATASELKESVGDLGYGQTYYLTQEQLRPFEDLLAIRLSAR